MLLDASSRRESQPSWHQNGSPVASVLLDASSRRESQPKGRSGRRVGERCSSTRRRGGSLNDVDQGLMNVQWARAPRRVVEGESQRPVQERLRVVLRPVLLDASSRRESQHVRLGDQDDFVGGAPRRVVEEGVSTSSPRGPSRKPPPCSSTRRRGGSPNTNVPELQIMFRRR